MIKDIIEANKDINYEEIKIQQLKDLFPGAFHDDIFDIEYVKNQLKEIRISNEGYELNFLGKSYAKLLAALDTETVIAPNDKHNNLPENINSENLYITSDNLEALKHLLKSYWKKFKVIYTDPPYNTGSDGFVYNDSFGFTKDSLVSKLGVSDEEANRILDMTHNGSSSHSAWLTFMYPRLYLARQLLSEDGIIFISIDDNEQANLKLLCDDIFGESNFICVFPRVTKKGGKSSDVTAKNHDYILAYAKDINSNDLSGVIHTDAGYSNKDEYFETRGYYKANQTLDYNSLGYSKSLDYPIEIDGEIFYPGGSKEEHLTRLSGKHGRADWAWRWSKDLYNFGLINGFLEIHRGGERPRIYTKTYQNVKINRNGSQYVIEQIDRTKPLSTLEFIDNKYSNDNAKKSFELVMKKGVFEYTKPVELIQRLLELLNGNDYYCLDFFSGSGTTGHAVINKNLEDGGSRKFVMIQLKEEVKENTEAFKQGYRYIDQIGIDRIKNAGLNAKLTLKQNQESHELLANTDQQSIIDTGFKHFEVKPVDSNQILKLESFTMDLFDDKGVLGEFGVETVLTTWINLDGYGLSKKWHELHLGNYTAYHIENTVYLLNPDISSFAVKVFLEKFEKDDFQCNKIVIFGYSFGMTDIQMIKDNLKQVEGIRHITLDIVVRY